MDKSLSRQDLIFTTKLQHTAIKSLFFSCETVGNGLIFQANTTLMHFKLLHYCTYIVGFFYSVLVGRVELR